LQALELGLFQDAPAMEVVAGQQAQDR
jgi:hypothetical protein